MFRKTVCAIALLLLPGWCFVADRCCGQETVAISEDREKAEEILDRFAAYFGGTMELAGRESYQIDCDVTWSGGEYVWSMKQQENLRAISQQSGRGLYFNDGVNRWTKINEKWTLSNRSVSWQSNLCFPHPWTIRNWMEVTAEFTYLGEKSIQNQWTDQAYEVDQLKLVGETGNELIYSFDKETGLMVHINFEPSKEQVIAGTTGRDLFFAYKEFDEFLTFSEYWSEYRDALFHMKVTLVDWEVEFPESEFPPMPEEIKQQLEERNQAGLLDKD